MRGRQSAVATALPQPALGYLALNCTRFAARKRFQGEGDPSSQQMNLDLVHKLLKATNEQPYGVLKVHGARFAREVEMMTAAGLVESAGPVHGLETYAVINRVTDSGHSFLRAFRDQPPLPGRPRISFSESSVLSATPQA